MTTVSPSARKIAGNASLQAFANCYLREVDAGTWYAAATWQSSTGVRLEQAETHVVELGLEPHGRTLALGVRFRSLVGRHTLTDVYCRQGPRREWQRIDGLSALLLLIDALYARQPESERRIELIGRLIESHQVMAKYVQRWCTEAAEGRPADAGGNAFLESEQSVVLGHWLHPTPKSRQGMLDWQHDHYTPEQRGHFQLHFFAAARRLVQQASLLERSAEELSQQLACHGADEGTVRRLAVLADDYCLIPLHPLQGQWLLHQDYVLALVADGALVDLGRLGPRFTPTSSVRTLYSESADFMIKLSIPVKITNALRINLQTELGDSVWVSQLLRACAVSEDFPELRPLEDPAYITLVLPDMEETGFEVIFRSNPFRQMDFLRYKNGVHSIAALVQEPVTDQHGSRLEELVRCLASTEGLELRQASLRWFDAYWRCAVEAPIRIYDRHGIALEAHQQNSLVELDPSGLPRRSYYRDIQGVGLSECSYDELVARVPELAQQTKVFEPDDIVRNGFGYYLFFNQLYAVINRFALDGLVDETVLLGVVRRKLVELRPGLHKLGKAFIDTLLETKAIPCKANLLTRVADMDELEAENELAVYTLVDNPLVAPELIHSPARATTPATREACAPDQA